MSGTCPVQGAHGLSPEVPGRASAPLESSRRCCGGGEFQHRRVSLRSVKGLLSGTQETRGCLGVSYEQAAPHPRFRLSRTDGVL